MVKKYEIKNDIIKAVDTGKRKKRVLVVSACKDCPCRTHRNGLPFCMATGEDIQLDSIDFPESCVLDTLREFYESLKKSQNESN